MTENRFSMETKTHKIEEKIMNKIINIINVRKSNCSYGNWSVTCMVKFPYGILQHTLFFWKKKQAMKVQAGDTFNNNFG